MFILRTLALAVGIAVGLTFAARAQTPAVTAICKDGTNWSGVTDAPRPIDLHQWVAGGFSDHGINSSMRSSGQPFTRRVRVWEM